jgi:hypothetical protein
MKTFFVQALDGSRYEFAANDMDEAIKLADARTAGEYLYAVEMSEEMRQMLGEEQGNLL